MSKKDEKPASQCPALKQFNEFQAKIKGRDKVCKAIQYGARAIKYYLLQADKSSKWGKRFENLANTAGTARKYFRLAKTLEEYEQVLELLAHPKSDSIDQYLNLIHRVSFMWYWFFDNVNFGVRAKFLTYDKKQVNLLASYGWTLGVAAQWLNVIYGMYNNFRDTASLDDKKEENKDKLKKLSDKRGKLYQDLVKQSCDLVVSSTSAQFPQQLLGKAPHDGILGVLGVISAFIGGYQDYFKA
eukprot:TRINITY_DN7419_c0_g1_i1.p1 TRINITY_DN7419_c0_g1~~TRINITY_DN7419_c0_g1_i1.p1  ORF type:complete len:258 (-),score=67.43 TRINITY_DN7419_c0_g1_i1:172-897(-)